MLEYTNIIIYNKTYLHTSVFTYRIIALTVNTDTSCPNKNPEKKQSKEFKPLSGLIISTDTPPKHIPNNNPNITRRGRQSLSNLASHINFQTLCITQLPPNPAKPLAYMFNIFTKK